MVTTAFSAFLDSHSCKISNVTLIFPVIHVINSAVP